MERLTKRLYMREHSNVIRKFQSLKMLDKMEENPIFNIEGTNRIIIVTICRIRQRLLTQAWRILTRNTGVMHDYEQDAKVILSRKLPDEELRTELEIEILFKWIYASKDADPTGIANTIFLCKKKAAVYNALQQLRLEFYEPGETVLFQGDIPRQEDGHFTIFNGACEVLQFPDESMPLMKLLYLAKKKKWDDARKLLNQAIILARIGKGSGFGELSTLTGVKRAATIRVEPSATYAAEIVVLPKQALLDCLKSRRSDGVEGAAPSEAMDFMRQSGLANRISPKDLVRVAESMVRRTLLQGEILFYRGETVKSLFLVVSGELLLDTGDFMVDGTPQAFVNSNPDNCYHMSSGSILGDEGATGQSNQFESTAVVVSDAAVVFEAVGYGMTFLTEKIGALRYCALTYRDKSRWDAPIHLAEEINPYTYFHSLRKAIAFTHPYRGSRQKIYSDRVDGDQESASPVSPTGASVKMGSVKFAHGKSEKDQGRKPTRLSPLMRMNSNLAFMMTEERNTNPAPTVEFSYPRQLKPVGLHHALEINRAAKKLAQKFMKVHAQENILYDQLSRNLMTAAPGKDQLEAEAKFKSHISEYRERAAKHSAQVQKQLEKERLAKTPVSTAVRFFGGLSPDNSVDGRDDLRGRRRGFSRDADNDDDSDSDLSDVVQSKPFSSSMLQRSRSKDEASDDRQGGKEGAAKDTGTEADKDLKPKDIRRELSAALMKSDMDQLRLTTTETDEDRAAYEDAQYFQRPKIVQYFIWMDHLNRHTYRALLQQAQQTIDQNFLRPNPERLVVTDKTMEELTNIFNRFGLTPTDMNIPWRPGSPKSGKAQFDDASDDEAQAVALSRVGTKPATPANVPTLEIAAAVAKAPHQPVRPEGTKKAAAEKMWGREDKEKERKLARIKVAGKFKTYHPASWRHELIMQKEKGVIKESYHLFTRSATPDNRRISVRYYHYPGHHHPDAQQSPTNAQQSRPQSRLLHSRPGTGHRHGADTHTTETMTASTIAEHEKQLELQEHFHNVPEKIMEAIQSVDLSKRREHLPDHEWKTRFLKCAVHESPGASAAGMKLERARKTQATRAIPSDSYSKQALLSTAKSILENNEKKYVLTDSTRILQASMQRGMLQSMRSARPLRSSYLSQTPSGDNTSRTTGRTGLAATAHAVALQFERDVHVHRADETCAATERSQETSLGHLSRDEDMAVGEGGDGHGERTAEGRDGHGDGDRESEGEAEGEDVEEDDEEEEGSEEEQAGDQAEEHHGGAGEIHGATTPEGSRTHGSPQPLSPLLTSRAGGVATDDRSIEEGALMASVMSPHAPAPLHIEQSGQSIEVQFNTLAPSGSVSGMHTPPPHTQDRPPFESANSVSSFDGNSPMTGAGGGGSSSTKKAADAAALRLKELKEKIIAKAPSDALEQFNNYMKTDNRPRAFYVGKKKASANSKFGLVSALRAAKADTLVKPSPAEVELLGLRKPAVSKDLALFNSLFPNSTEEQRREFLEKARRERLGLVDPAPTEAAGRTTASTGDALGHPRMSVKDVRLGPPAELPRGRAAASAAGQELAEMMANTGHGGDEEEELDPDIVMWQNFTIDTMHREKTGPKKILPVLILKNEAGASSRRFAVNKSKRWGSGVLLELAAQADEEPIAGPPSYLEIFKGAQRRKLREKDRKRITDELHALIR